MSADREWLDSLKAGDVVGVSVSRHDPYLATVTRRTKSAIFANTSGRADYEYRFRAINGRLVGQDSWSFTYLCPTNDRRFVSDMAQARVIRKAYEFGKWVHALRDEATLDQIADLKALAESLAPKVTP